MFDKSKGLFKETPLFAIVAPLFAGAAPLFTKGRVADSCDTIGISDALSSLGSLTPSNQVLTVSMFNLLPPLLSSVPTCSSAPVLFPLAYVRLY